MKTKNENRKETGEDTYAGRFAPLAEVPLLPFLFSFSFYSMFNLNSKVRFSLAKNTETPLDTELEYAFIIELRDKILTRNFDTELDISLASPWGMGRGSQPLLEILQ